jgi:hypothetical protein
MAKKKARQESLFEATLREFDEWKEKNPILETRYVVLEKKKVWYDSDYGDQYGGQTVRQFNFATNDERMDWLAEHVPDSGCEFSKHNEYLRLVTPDPYKEWFTY